METARSPVSFAHADPNAQRALEAALDAQWLQGEIEKTRGLSYPEMLERGWTGAGKDIALVHRDATYTYPALFRAINGTAESLRRDLGLSPGQRVLLILDNSDLYVIAYLAILRAGAVAVPTNPKLAAPEIAHLLKDARPALFICDEQGEALANAACSLAGVMIPICQAGALCRFDGPAEPLPDVDPAAPAALFYTSGTTGRPKGVIHTHETLIAGGLQSARAWDYDRAGLVTLAATPLFHVAAHAWFLPTLAYRGTLVVDTYSTQRMFELIEGHRVNGFGAVPSMLLIMARFEQREAFDLSSVVNVRFGASPMPPDKLRDVQALFPNALLHHGMGQTESGGTISVLNGRQAFEKAGGTGYPLPGCSVRIVDETGNDVQNGEVGEVLARGPNVMVGYFNRPKETQATLAHGWLHTGDLGFMDEDQCIYLVDRKKDMIIRGGENIYSVEVENILCAHPQVLACAVVGLPDDLLGESVCAVVVTSAADTQVLADELRDFCATCMAPFKMPARYEIVDDMPRTATGKIQKGALRERLLACPAAPRPAGGRPAPVRTGSFILTAGDFGVLGHDLARPESVLALADGRVVTSNRAALVTIIHPDGRQETRGTGAGLPNGVAVDGQGRILVADMERGLVHRLHADGHQDVIADRHDDAPLGAANFVLADGDDACWITVSTRLSPFKAAIEEKIADGRIYRWRDGELRLVADGLSFANELRLDAARAWAYVAETTAGRISRAPVRPDGSLGAFEPFGPAPVYPGAFVDGIAFDAEGNLWVTELSRNAILVLRPNGEMVRAFEDPEGRVLSKPTSLAFAGPDRRSVLVGSLHMPHLAIFRAPHPGAPLGHWPDPTGAV